MKKWTPIFLLITPFLLTGSCQKKNTLPKTQELRVNIHSEPPTLDPRKAGDTTSIAVIKMLFEGLTRIDSNGQPVFAMAESMDLSDDMLSAVFHLRQAYWTDGHPVTAFDFESSWKAALDPAFPSYSAFNLYVIKGAREAKELSAPLSEVGVKALDEKTLLIELEHPVTYLLELLTTSVFLPTPSHITASFPYWAEKSGTHFVSNGPFALTDWRSYNAIIAEKNTTYWDKEAVRLEKIHIYMVEDEGTELSMFQNGDLDWAGSPLSSLPIDSLKTLEKRDKLFRFPESGTYYYLFNTKVPPFDNVCIRKAFALAIDRQVIVDNVIQGHQIPATGLIPPTMWKESISYFKDADVEEAKRLFAKGLKQLGVTADELPPIVLTYNTVQAHHKIAQAIQQQWFEAFGIRVHLENKEWKVYLDELIKKQFQVARLGGMANFNDPICFLENYKYPNSAQNFSQWENSQFTKLLDKASRCTDAKKRIQLLKEAEKILIDEMPLIPIYFYMGSYLKKPYVQGVYVSELSDVDFKCAYVETAQ